MKLLFAGVMFFLMSVILYSANAISVSIFKLNGGGQSEVGYSLIVFSVITFIMGIILLSMSERAVKFGAEETKERKKSFLDSDLDN